MAIGGSIDDGPFQDIVALDFPAKFRDIFSFAMTTGSGGGSLLIYEAPSGLSGGASSRPPFEGYASDDYVEMYDGDGEILFAEYNFRMEPGKPAFFGPTFNQGCPNFDTSDAKRIDFSYLHDKGSLLNMSPIRSMKIKDSAGATKWVVPLELENRCEDSSTILKHGNDNFVAP